MAICSANPAGALMTIFKQHTPSLAHYNQQLRRAAAAAGAASQGVLLSTSRLKRIFQKSSGLHGWTMMMMMINYPNDTHVDGAYVENFNLVLHYFRVKELLNEKHLAEKNL